MKNLLVSFVLTGLLLCPRTAPTQSTSQNPCNERQTFCWYGPYPDGSDEVNAWGNVWITSDPTEKALKQITEVRCIKRLRICIKARNQPLLGGSMTNIDIYNVRSWTNSRVEAVNDELADPQCEQERLILNRAEQRAILISSPGPMADKGNCTKIMGAPKTVLYKLSA